MKCIIVRYSEIGLKGKNKIDFEIKLSDNIKAYLKKNKIKFLKVVRMFSRILIITDEKADLSKVFGVSSYSYGTLTGREISEIKKEADKLIRNFSTKTEFRVSSQRLDKGYKISSMELDRKLGSHIVKKTGAIVNLNNYEKEIGVEILPNESFIFEGKTKGSGGLPVGIEGRVVVLIEDNESANAGKLMMKRGCDIILAGKEEISISDLEIYSQKKIEFHKVNNIRDIEKLANKEGAKALVVGQRLDNFKEVDTNILVLRPLIGE